MTAKIYGKGRDKYRIVRNPKNDPYQAKGFTYRKVFINGSGYLYLHKNKLPAGV